MASSDGLDESLLDDLDLDGGFTIPVGSVGNALKEEREEAMAIAVEYISSVHAQSLAYEFQHIEQRLNQQHKNSTYETVKQQEECKRVHEDMSVKETKDCEKLIEALTTPHANNENDNNNSNIDMVQLLVQTYVNQYASKLRQASTFAFPWTTYDDAVQHQCLTFLTTLHQQQQQQPTTQQQAQQSSTTTVLVSPVDECRAYLIGYLECVCRVTPLEQSKQGRSFTNQLAWACGRHPFGTLFTTIVATVRVLLRRVQKHLLPPSNLCEQLQHMIRYLKLLWLSCWKSFDTASIGAAMNEEITELFEEALQHVLFLSVPNLTHVFFESPPPSSSSSTSLLLDRNNNNNNNNSNTTVARLQVEEDSLLRKEHANDVIAEAHFVQPTRTTTTTTITTVLEPLSDTELQSIMEIKRKFFSNALPNPFAAVRVDLMALELSKTPGEALSATLGLTTHVETIARELASNYHRTKAAANHDNNNNNNNNFLPQASESVSAEDLLPLIEFSFALYFQRLWQQQQQQKSMGSPVRRMAALLQVADLFLPRHLLVRKEGFALVTVASALHSLPSKYSF